MEQYKFFDQKIPENIQSQLKNARNSNKHVNNSTGQRNQQQLYMQQYMIETQYLQQCMMQYVLNQQQNCIKDMCIRIKNDSKDEYVQKTVNDIKKLGEEFKIKQALTQLKKLCSHKDATKKQQDILKEVEKYLQSC